MANKTVRVLILRTAGTNCDEETAFAFKESGADVKLVHINRFIEKRDSLFNYHILSIPGGFSYGDDIASGRILANELRFYLIDDLIEFIRTGRLIIGICNGFQVLVKAGILPGVDKWTDTRTPTQTVTLISNDSGKFEDRWVYLKVYGDSPWTQGLSDIIYLPVAHAEGKFVVKNKKILKQLKDNRQIAFRYCNDPRMRIDDNIVQYPANPNGSIYNIAGITDISGHVLGMMPHPERHFLFHQHPYWRRLRMVTRFGDGALIFKNGVEYIEKNLL